MAATITWTKAQVTVLDSALVLTDAEFLFYATEAAAEIGEDDRFGEQQNYAGILLTAHYASVSSAQPLSMPINRESVQGSQGIMKQYAIRTFGAEDFSMSRYGIMYRRLLLRHCRGGTLT